MLARTGVPTPSDLELAAPSAERLARRRVAIVECFQEIPCDPCADACPFGAIKPFADVNARPEVLPEACVGCALCLTKCPGLAIFLVDLTYSADHALVTIPYEFLPVPAPGDVVNALDREGRRMADARVVMVQDSPAHNRTRVVWLEVPRELAMTVRSIRVGDGPADHWGSAGGGQQQTGSTPGGAPPADSGRV